jgi:hypothetical protein
MSNYQPAVPTGARPTRPGVVTAAGYLLYVVAVLYAATAIISLATIGKVMNAVEADSVSDDGPDLKTVVQVTVVIEAIFYLLIVALFVVLGAFVLRGRNGMRITTWVIAGLGVLCTFCGAVGGGLSSTLASQENSLDSTQSEQIQNALPDWARYSTIALDVIILILLGVVIVFLALRPANAFFRRPEPIMIVGYPGYGGYPTAGYPGSPYPAYPQPGEPAYPEPGQPVYPQPSQPTYPQAGEPVYPQAPPVPPAPASPWATPGGPVPTQPGPADDSIDDNQTRQDPQQS